MDTDDADLDSARRPADAAALALARLPDGELATFKPRRPEATVLYQVMARHLHTVLRLSNPDGGRAFRA